MRAITIPRPGGPEVLQWVDVPDPEPGPDEVLVEIAASAVNRADIQQRQGHYPPPAGAPPYPGLECSGVIAATGEQVCALLAGGGYAERVAVPRAHTLPIPAGIALQDAAALPEVACTVWSNVVRIARLQKGETLLVHGGGSGIGTFAIQLGKALGAHVVTTARKAKHDALKELGADVTIDYPTEDWSKAGARRRHPGHHRRQVPRPQHRGARAQRAHRGHRAPRWTHGRAGPAGADGQARHDLRDHAAARARTTRRRRSYGGCASRSGR